MYYKRSQKICILTALADERDLGLTRQIGISNFNIALTPRAWLQPGTDFRGQHYFAHRHTTYERNDLNIEQHINDQLIVIENIKKITILDKNGHMDMENTWAKLVTLQNRGKLIPTILEGTTGHTSWLY